LINPFPAAADHRGALLQAGAGIAASRLAAFTILPRPFQGAELMTTLLRLCAVAMVSGVLAAGCAARGVRIAELKDRPDKYERKNVSVEGVVTRSWGIPLLPVQLYSVDDGSGEISVLSRGSRTPSTGARVRVNGKVTELGVFGGRSIGLHLQENDRRIKD
jgi:hypothetical protein